MEGSKPVESNLPWPRDVRPPDTSQFFHKDTYAPSQFNLMKLLSRLAQRPNPQISLGPIDCSAAIIVCDTSLEDSPIVYCSEAFCDLTGYSLSDVLGRNCRFLQSPGITNKGRAGVDQARVLGSPPTHTVDLKQELARMKTSLSRNEEVQVVVLNYTKSGKPFLNLVTVVPVEPEPEPDGDNHRYLVGFQANSISTV